jgi:G3E family GTPase
VSAAGSTGAIPVTIIAGFLGAGKTSLLNRALAGKHERRVGVLVNDFGAINIDAALVSQSADGVISLANGCICCSMRGDLLAAAARLLAVSAAPEHILIETSGLSHPSAVAETLGSPGLSAHLRLDAVIGVIDAERLTALAGEQLELALDQAAASDLIILNKVDLATDAQIEKAKACLREIVPQARMIESIHGNVDVELLYGLGPVRREASRAAVRTKHTADYQSMSWVCRQALDLDRLHALLARFPIGILRAKGVLLVSQAPEMRGVFHLVGKRASLSFQERWRGRPCNELVILGARGAFNEDAMRNELQACLASA